MSVGAVGRSTGCYNSDKSKDKTAAGNGYDFSKAIQEFKDANQLTAQELKEDKGWREMSDDEWEKMLEGVDGYIDGIRERLKELKEQQEEAVKKAAMQAAPDMRTIAAASAALKVAANEAGSVVTGAVDDGADGRADWTKNLDTDDQTVLRTAETARNKQTMTRLQEQQLLWDAAGIVQTGNVTDSALNEKDKNKDKI